MYQWGVAIDVRVDIVITTLGTPALEQAFVKIDLQAHINKICLQLESINLSFVIKKLQMRTTPVENKVTASPLKIFMYLSSRTIHTSQELSV